MPGPRRLSELRKKITDQGALCVFSEPQFTSGLVDTVLSGTKARGGRHMRRRGKIEHHGAHKT